MRLYLDSCVLIYALDGADRLGNHTLLQLEHYADADWVISDLVRMEWLVGPLRKGFLNLLIQLLDAPGAGCDRRGYAEPSWPPPEE
jgi:hypothetical protein